MPSKKLLVAAGLAALALVGCRSCGTERTRARPPAPPVLARPAVLAVLPDEPAPQRGGSAPAAAPPHWPIEYVFAERGGAVAWHEPGADGKHRVFFDGRPGPPFDDVGNVALTADGLHHAYGGQAGGAWRLVRDGTPEGAPYKEFGTLVYSPDGAHVLFTAHVVDEEDQLVVDGVVRRTSRVDFVAHDFGADSRSVVFMEPVDARTGRIAVADLAFRSVTVVEEHALSMKMSPDRSRVATVAEVEGGVRVLSFDVDDPDRVRRGRTYERVAAVDFGPGGFPLAYYALRKGQTIFVVEDEEAELRDGERVVGGASFGQGQRGFGALVRFQGSVTLRELFTANPPRREPSYEEATELVYGAEGRVHAYVARRGDRWFVVANGKESTPHDGIRSPQFSPDGSFLVYRARDAGRRFVVIADPDGKVLRELPRYDEVHDVRFTADGRSIAYGVKDGRELAWKVEPLP